MTMKLCTIFLVLEKKTVGGFVQGCGDGFRLQESTASVFVPFSPVLSSIVPVLAGALLRRPCCPSSYQHRRLLSSHSTFSSFQFFYSIQSSPGSILHLCSQYYVSALEIKPWLTDFPGKVVGVSISSQAPSAKVAPVKEAAKVCIALEDDNLHLIILDMMCIKYNVWTSTPNGNQKLNSASEETSKFDFFNALNKKRRT
ncbi:hypothetical protein Ccrd_024916 [Cynara cardunculus var. scolymus]|uniref:Uncharacterized protein n=1 Tax=Cynara cardunculus var. scolymus TaxID=59895 RepID=A0A103XBR6_CYNCS|nr:hypothetical protein Ccrd_024916 [Cynara cardunculus var. scolymus]